MSIASCCVTATGLTDGLVGYWSFDGNVKDGSGRGHKLSGSVAYTVDRNGRDNSAAVFDGTTSLKLPQSLYVARSLTVSVWCKPSGNIPTGLRETISETDGATMVGSQYVLYPSHGGFSSTGKAGVGLIVGQNGVIMMEHADGYCPIPLVCYGNIGNNWALVTVTISGNGAPQLYINGDFIKKGMASSKTKFVGASDWSLPDAYPENNEQYRGYYWGAIIGNGATVAYSHCPYYGFMDDFRIYNRALEASEIKSLYEEEVVQLNEVTFDANRGEGSMENETVITGSDLLLPANKFRNNGFVFQGWALSPSGEVIYKDEAEIQVYHDMTLYAVWVNPPLTLVAESANWSSGSITLRCTDADTSGRTHTYTLQYYDESTGTWKDVSSVQTASASASLTDMAFSSRLGGIPPVKYRVKDENGRASAECVTRNRHGLFVGVGEFEDGEERGLSRLPGVASDASEFKRIAEEYAKFIGPVYTNQEADTNTVDAALEDFVESSQIGDICLFYVTTHGGYDGGEGAFCLYDGDYTHSDLAEKVSRMASKGIAFVAIVGTCHAEAMLQMDFPNAAVVAAATMNDLSTATFDKILMNDGWENCCAANGSIMTFGNLADYAIEKYNGIFAEINFVDEKGAECYPYRMSATKNDVGGLLGKIVARADCNPTSNSATKPSGVVGFSATTNNSSRVTVSWDSVDGTDRYYLFFGRLGQYLVGYKEFNRDETDYTLSALWNDWIKESSKAAPIQFMIKAYNVDAGAGPAVITKGWLYKTYAISFYTIDHERIEWEEPSFDRSYDDSVFKTFELGDEYVLKFLPEAKKSGHYLKGWYDLDGNEAIVGQTFSSDAMYHAEWKEIAMPQIWLDDHIGIVERSGGDLATAAAMTAANGTRTVDECYRRGIDPEDQNDDLKITDFKMEDGKPVITLNHTKDGSGNSFESRIKTLGKANLTDADWVDVTDKDQSAYRFFKVKVDMP